MPQVGEVFRQPQLGHTFRRLIDAESHAGGDRKARIYAARDLLYRGELARQIATFYQEQGSLLRNPTWRSSASAWSPRRTPPTATWTSTPVAPGARAPACCWP